MRLLYLTDTHIRGTSPRSRRDDFLETLRMKLNEVIEIAEQEKVDFLLHGGDVFDRPSLSPSVIREFAKLFRRFQVPMYAIAGNHDLYGHNPATINRTMLGLLEAFGVFHLIHEGEKIRLEKGNRVVQLTGQPFHYDLDKRDCTIDYQVKNEMKADYCIHMVHGMLVERALPEEVPHTMVQEVWNKDVDILLTGHYHAGFPIQEKDGKYIVNPGALVRINNHTSEMNRMPQVVLLDLNEEINIRLIPLSCALPGEQILDRSYLKEMTYRQERLVSFIQEVRSVSNFQKMEVFDILNEISQLHGIEDKIKREAVRRVGMAQEASREDMK